MVSVQDKCVSIKMLISALKYSITSQQCPSGFQPLEFHEITWRGWYRSYGGGTAPSFCCAACTWIGAWALCEACGCGDPWG